MIVSRSRIPTVAGTAHRGSSGLGPGEFPAGAVAGRRRRPLGRVDRGDRAGAHAVRRGSQRHRPARAVYFLDYKGGRLLATVPSYHQTTTTTQLIERFAERDLVADFKLDLDTGPRPRFLMTTGRSGPTARAGRRSTSSRRPPARSASTGCRSSRRSATTSRPRFELVELRSYAKAGATRPSPLSGDASRHGAARGDSSAVRLAGGHPPRRPCRPGRPAGPAPAAARRPPASAAVARPPVPR